MANAATLPPILIMSATLIKTKVTEGGRIVIPANVRRALDMRVGEDVTLEIDRDELRIRTSHAALRRLQKMVRERVPAERSIVDEFLRERRKEATLDD